MKKTLFPLLFIVLVHSTVISQNQIIDQPLIVQNAGDAITSFKTLDNTWLYTQWLNSSNQRKAYMGLNNDLSQFRLNLENGANSFVVNGGNVGIGTYNPYAPLHISSASDGILTLQSTDDTWLYTQWLNSTNQRKAYMGFNPDLTQFRLNLENGADRFVINGGNVGIGTYNPGNWKLAVNGQIRAKEIKVETGWSDFVFHDDYNLPSIKDVEKHIKEKGHLKDIPSAKEVEKNGIFLGEMDSKLLQKIEELTLYTIQQQKEIEKLKLQNQKLIELHNRLEKLEKGK